MVDQPGRELGLADRVAGFHAQPVLDRRARRPPLQVVLLDRALLVGIALFLLPQGERVGVDHLLLARVLGVATPGRPAELFGDIALRVEAVGCKGAASVTAAAALDLSFRANLQRQSRGER